MKDVRGHFKRHHQRKSSWKSGWFLALVITGIGFVIAFNQGMTFEDCMTAIDRVVATVVDFLQPTEFDFSDLSTAELFVKSLVDNAEGVAAHRELERVLRNDAIGRLRTAHALPETMMFDTLVEHADRGDKYSYVVRGAAEALNFWIEYVCEASSVQLYYVEVGGSVSYGTSSLYTTFTK